MFTLPEATRYAATAATPVLESLALCSVHDGGTVAAAARTELRCRSDRHVEISSTAALRLASDLPGPVLDVLARSGAGVVGATARALQLRTKDAEVDQ